MSAELQAARAQLEAAALAYYAASLPGAEPIDGMHARHICGVRMKRAADHFGRVLYEITNLRETA